MTRILLLETSAATLSVALAQDGKVVADRICTEPRMQSSLTAPLVKEVMDEAGIGFDALDAVFVGKCHVGQTVAHLTLARRMYALPFAQIYCGRHAAVGNLCQSGLLGLEEVAAQGRRAHAVIVWSDLHKVERSFRIAEQLPHHLHVGRLQAGVLLRAVAVAFALVPQHPFEPSGRSDASYAF